MIIILIDSGGKFLYSYVCKEREARHSAASAGLTYHHIIQRGCFNMNQMMRKYAPALMALLIAVLAGCSSNNNQASFSSPAASPAATESAAPSETAAAETAAPALSTEYPLSLENYTNNGEGTEWQSKTLVFDHAPEKVVANTQGAAELMIKLGLTDRLIGVAALFGAGDPDVAGEFQNIPVISEGYASKELVVGASPDLVMGRADLYADADWGVGTVAGLDELGIQSFVQSTSLKGATLDSLYADIEQLGQIFDVQERASEYNGQLRQRAQDLKDRTGGQQRAFAYVFPGDDNITSVYSGNIDTFAGDVLGLLGLDNVFEDVTGEVSKEQLIAADPDVLLISVYTGGPNAEQLMERVYNDESISSLKAIRNKAVYTIDFNQFWGYSYSIFDGAEKLAAELETAQ